MLVVQIFYQFRIAVAIICNMHEDFFRCSVFLTLSRRAKTVIQYTKDFKTIKVKSEQMNFHFLNKHSYM